MNYDPIGLYQRVLACPLDRRSLSWDDQQNVWQCPACKRTFPFKEGIGDFISSLPDAGRHSDVVKANQAIHNHLGDRYEKDPLIKQQFSASSKARLRQVLAEISLALPTPASTCLVDVGTGTGLVLDVSAGLFDISLGFDVSREILLAARSRGHLVHLGDACRLPLLDESADVVVMDSVLHHIYQWPVAVGEAFRILRPGGYLVTDWDPNGKVTRIQQKKSYQLILALSKIIRRGLAGFRDNLSQPEFKLAEYHRFYGGIFPDQMKTELLATGFSDVKIVIHSNHKSIRRLTILAMPPISLLRTLIMMVLGATTNRKEIFEILMSISRK